MIKQISYGFLEDYPNPVASLTPIGEKGYYLNTTMVKAPSNFFFLVDALTPSTGLGTYTVKRNTDWCPITFLHGSGLCNTLFLDGHAVSLDLNAMLNQPNSHPWQKKFYFHSPRHGWNVQY